MNRITPHATKFDSLRKKVVVLSGGANAIGAATVERLYNDRARVVFGDVDEAAARDLIARLASQDSKEGEVTFVKCDTTKHGDVYQLFKTAHDTYGKVDHAFSIAGIFEQGNWFDPDLTIESIERAEETPAVLEINLKGTTIFARIAIVFLRNKKHRKDNRSLTLTSSVAGIWECPGLFMHQASSHGILGLMRAMRKPIHEQHGIRVNCICPGVTGSALVASAIELSEENGNVQTADDCARFYLGVAKNPGMNGKAIYVEGGKGWEFEEGLSSTMPQWLGEEPAKLLKANMKTFAKIT